MNHEDKENFFPRAERSRMVYDILLRTRYGNSSKEEESYAVGIERLIKNGTYRAAYPLHEVMFSMLFAPFSFSKLPTTPKKR